ncbi:chalcone isomerase family protein [Noviherbaspirillum galbum]|uniref:Lipoprotein transmembrane n=1 Tax=Noviherbaspirillum galbum TaxID=2709383 RepID=A0A6B3SG24_9BURK|nr:chalcone isomerase family protein [Noviherbaspirillum galbum]NEX59837.1 lipoprotein transmembrane [Noviherbaspirillum galbum]
MNINGIRTKFAMAAMLACLGQAAMAMDVNGVKLDDAVKVANQDLKLNGAGIRTKAIFKVYVAGLYLPEKKKTPADILAAQGARRMRLVMLREVNSEEFGQAFMDGLNANSDKGEKAKFVNQTVKMGEIFAAIPSLKQGDTVTSDWIPGTGMQILVNDKKVGDVMPDPAFYNAFLRIWLGDKPADADLKNKLLGG